MAETKHTPGKWGANEFQVYSALDDGTIMLLANLREDRSMQPGERAVNAALFAAAPELVAVCRVLITSITDILDPEHPTLANWVNARTAVHLGRAAIAIAKAKPLTIADEETP